MESKIIDYAMDGDAVKFREELYGAIHDKVSAHIEAAKQAVAQNFIPSGVDEPEEQEISSDNNAEENV
jgi:hypothetical protein